MKRYHPLQFAIAAALSSASAFAQDTFDWSLLDGNWAESTEHQFGCRQDNLHQHVNVSADRKTLVFKNDRKWLIADGQEVESYAAAIVSQAPNVLVIRYGPELKDIPDEYREWEMRFIGPGTYRWRATGWPKGTYNDVIGVKCGAK
jgi:hypothetical protein